VKTWQGRFATLSSSLFESFTSSVEQDQVLAVYDLSVSKAHAGALARAGLFTNEEAERLVEALGEIGDEIEAGLMEWCDELEDVHTHIEARLREKVGDLAGKLHTGRSRNDQIAADLRLYVIAHCERVESLLLDLIESVLDLAGKYEDALMPGYTHLQQAQPVLIAYPLLAYWQMLRRDLTRFQAAAEASRRSPLGSGAIAGSTFDLDRQFLGEQVGLGSPIENSLDGVSDRDFAVDFISAAAICMTHLSRMAEDVILWSTQEFGFVRLPDDFASGSSMMPQKKNPDVLELIRGKAALVIGDLTAILSLLKGLPLAYDRDLQEDKTPLFHAASTVEASLEILAVMLPKLRFDTDRCSSAISGFAMATDLADELVRAGTPFRDAHAVVGRLVEECIQSGRALADLDLSDLQAAGADLKALPDLTPQASIRRKATTGSTHPDEVRKAIAAAREFVKRKRVASHSGQQSSTNSEQRTANSEQPAANSQQPTANGQHRT
jgi:argininosuccinate lyase